MAIIYAVTNGYLNTIPVSDIPEFEKQLFEYMDTKGYDALTAIRQSGKLEPETENAIKAALTELVSKF